MEDEVSAQRQPRGRSGNTKTKTWTDSSSHASLTSRRPCRWESFYFRFSEVVLMPLLLQLGRGGERTGHRQFGFQSRGPSSTPCSRGLSRELYQDSGAALRSIFFPLPSYRAYSFLCALLKHPMLPHSLRRATWGLCCYQKEALLIIMQERSFFFPNLAF